MINAHSYVIITKKLHAIPYHAVNHWNEVFNPFLPRQLLFSASKARYNHDINRTSHAEKIFFHRILKNSSTKFGSCLSITLLTDVTLSSELHKQQKIIDSLSSKG